eukprot:gene22376-29480_t
MCKSQLGWKFTGQQCDSAPSPQPGKFFTPFCLGFRYFALKLSSRGKVASRADSWARPQSLRRLRKTCWIAHAAAVDDADAGEGDDEADEGEGEGEGEGEEGEDEGEQGEGEEDGRWDLGRELSYADNLNIEFGVPTMIEFLEEEEGQPRLWLKHPYSSMALEVYLHGAAITQWLRPDGTDNLFAPPSETFSPSTAMK